LSHFHSLGVVLLNLLPLEFALPERGEKYLNYSTFGGHEPTEITDDQEKEGFLMP
jgi:hypothetical protein